MALAHLIEHGHALLERDQIGLGLAVQPDIGKHGHAKTERFGVEIGMIAADTAGFFERPHPAQAGRRRDAGIPRQLDIRHAAVILQVAQDFQIYLIELDSGHWRNFR